MLGVGAHNFEEPDKNTQSIASFFGAKVATGEPPATTGTEAGKILDVCSSSSSSSFPGCDNNGAVMTEEEAWSELKNRKKKRPRENPLGFVREEATDLGVGGKCRRPEKADDRPAGTAAATGGGSELFVVDDREASGDHGGDAAAAPGKLVEDLCAESSDEAAPDDKEEDEEGDVGLEVTVRNSNNSKDNKNNNSSKEDGLHAVPGRQEEATGSATATSTTAADVADASASGHQCHAQGDARGNHRMHEQDNRGRVRETRSLGAWEEGGATGNGPPSDDAGVEVFSDSGATYHSRCDGRAEANGYGVAYGGRLSEGGGGSSCGEDERERERQREAEAPRVVVAAAAAAEPQRVFGNGGIGGGFGEVDPEVLRELPPDIQREIKMQQVRLWPFGFMAG